MNCNQIESETKLPGISKYQLLYFVLWPFGVLIHSLRNLRDPSSKTLFWLFCLYFGFVYIYDDPFAKGGADSARYAAQLIEFHNNPISLEALISSFYVSHSYADIYQPIATWLVSLFTGDPRFLFMLFAAVFGFFYTQNLWMVFNTINKKIGWTLLLFMFYFALVNPIWQITGVRMWTAAQIFLYGNLRYFLFNDKKGLGWCVATILVHFSFILPVTVLLGWLFMPKKTTLFFWFFVVTAFFNEIDIEIFRNLITWLPDVFQLRAERYTSDAAVERLYMDSFGWSWHVVFARISIRWLTYMWVIAVFIRRKQWTAFLPGLSRLFSYALLLGGGANLLTSVLSGGRFSTVAAGLLYALFVALLGQNQIRLKLKSFEVITIPFLVFNIIFRIRMGFDYSGIFTFLGNPIIAPFISNDTPLIDFIKQLLQ